MIYNSESRKGPDSHRSAPRLREKGLVVERHNP
jgi:hypothetical protein